MQMREGVSSPGADVGGVAAHSSIFLPSSSSILWKSSTSYLRKAHSAMHATAATRRPKAEQRAAWRTRAAVVGGTQRGLVCVEGQRGGNWLGCDDVSNVPGKHVAT